MKPLFILLLWNFIFTAFASEIMPLDGNYVLTDKFAEQPNIISIALAATIDNGVIK